MPVAKEQIRQIIADNNIAKPISGQQLRWLLEGLNPEQPKAVQKRYPKQAENL